MKLEALIAAAQEQGASDVHIEPGLAVGMRINGRLTTSGEPVNTAHATTLAREILGDEWPVFHEHRSFDVSRTIRGTRCRINVLHTSRGIGLAIRLLSSFQPTLKKLNLHPDVRRLLAERQGLIVVTGPTGSGKTSTLAALVQELNTSEPMHVVTVENPIEYSLRPQQCFIRQREVGRDTPSFQQALIDAMREDPDVLMVGEMRDPETMRLTLNASETGHLVLTTMHSSTSAEALQRLVSSFPAEMQGGVCAQLADCLIGVVAQRLKWRPGAKLRVPELEILVATSGVRAMIRQGQFFKLPSAIETGGADGMWSFARYREWLDGRSDWVMPGPPELSSESSAEEAPVAKPAVVTPAAVAPPVVVKKPATPARTVAAKPGAAAPDDDPTSIIELNPAEADDLEKILSEMEKRKK